MIYYRIAGRSYCRFEAADRIALLALVTIIALVVLCSCAHEPISDPRGPGNVIVGVTRDGVIFNDAGRNLWISESVPSSYFTQAGRPGRWYISSVNFHQGELIRLNRANP